MGFRVYQGIEQDANEIQVLHDGKVFLTNKKNAPFRLKPSEPVQGEQPEVLPSKPADRVAVFVNEDPGRDVIVKWDATTGTPPQVATARTQQVAAAVPGVGEWQVVSDWDNVDNDPIDAAYQAKLPNGWQSGPSVKFTMSLCGLDSFIVTYRFTQGGRQQLQYVIVTVRKRLHCHLFEMKRSARAVNTGTFDEYRGPLGKARQFLSERFGIDLVFPDNGAILPEGTTSFLGPQTKDQLYRMIAPAHASNRPPRHLWFNVVDSIHGHEIGWGGSSLVSLDVSKLKNEGREKAQWLDSWRAYEKTNYPDADEQAWVDSAFKNPRLSGGERDTALALARGHIDPAGIVQMAMYTTALHEIGHALGLVPLNEQAGGNHQSGWGETDRNHKGHCAKVSCAMFWRADSEQNGLGIRIGPYEPFDHDTSSLHMDGCFLFLRACDLQNIRRLPQ